MEIQEKTGLAVPQIEAYKEALRVNQGGEWLVKRRVKVWWDGNQRYFDADVLDYDPVKGIHTIQYLEDGQISKEILALNKQQVREKYSPWLDMKEENISGCVGAQCKSLVEPESSVEAPQMATNGVELVSSKDSNGTVSVKPVWDWLWLDESRKDLMIKKKSDSELREADDLPLNDNETSQNIKEDTSKVPMPSFTRPSSSPTAKIPAKLSADICRYILDQHEICYGDADFRGLIRLLTDLMKSQYETYIRLKLHVDSPEDELPVYSFYP